MAPLLFALGFKPHLEQLESDLRRLAVERGLDPSRIHLLAYLDDVTILEQLCPMLVRELVFPICWPFIGQIELCTNSVGQLAGA